MAVMAVPQPGATLVERRMEGDLGRSSVSRVLQQGVLGGAGSCPVSGTCRCSVHVGFTELSGQGWETAQHPWGDAQSP